MWLVFLRGAKNKKKLKITHPDLFFVPTATAPGNGEAQVDATTTVATRERGIFGLRVHAQGRGAHAEAVRDARVGVERGVRRVDRLEEGELVQR